MKMPCLVTAALLACPAFSGAQEDDWLVRRRAEQVSQHVARSADGIPIHYEVRGARTGDPTLVLIHGWSHNRKFWEPHSTTLAETHQVVAVDLAGFGESGTGRAAWTVEAFGEDVAAAVNQLGVERVVLIGFSMGGPVALEAALRVPGRVVGVILVDTLHDPLAATSEEEIRKLLTTWREEWGTPEWVRRVGFNDSTPSFYVDRCLSMIPETAPERWWSALEESGRWRGTNAIRALERIEVPVTAINSDRLPTNVDSFRQYIPSFTVRTMSGVGHLGVLWRNTEEFDQYVRELVQIMTGG